MIGFEFLFSGSGCGNAEPLFDQILCADGNGERVELEHEQK
jgi:hypothetical protein